MAEYREVSKLVSGGSVVVVWTIWGQMLGSGFGFGLIVLSSQMSCSNVHLHRMSLEILPFTLHGLDSLTGAMKSPSPSLSSMTVICSHLNHLHNRHHLQHCHQHHADIVFFWTVHQSMYNSLRTNEGGGEGVGGGGGRKKVRKQASKQASKKKERKKGTKWNETKEQQKQETVAIATTVAATTTKATATLRTGLLSCANDKFRHHCNAHGHLNPHRDHDDNLHPNQNHHHSLLSPCCYADSFSPSSPPTTSLAKSAGDTRIGLRSIHTSDINIRILVARVTGSALGLVGPVAVFCDWVK